MNAANIKNVEKIQTSGFNTNLPNAKNSISSDAKKQNASYKPHLIECQETIWQNKLFDSEKNILFSFDSELVSEYDLERENANLTKIRQNLEKPCGLDKPSKYACELAMSFSSDYFSLFPDESKTSEICWQAIKCNPRLISSVPKNKLTLAMCEYAVSKDDALFKNIPEAFISQYLALIAVVKNPGNIKYVPGHLLTADICNKAMENQPDSSELWNFVPSKFKQLSIKQNLLTESNHNSANLNVDDSNR